MSKYKRNVRKKTHKKVIRSVKSYLSELHFRWAREWMQNTVLKQMPSLDIEFIFYSYTKKNLFISITKGGQPSAADNYLTADKQQELISCLDSLHPHPKIRQFRHLTHDDSSLIISKLIQDV